MGKRHFRLSVVLAGGAACAVALSPALGQQQTATQQGGAGPSVTLGFSSSLRFDDNSGLDTNPLGESTIWDNNIALKVRNDTGNSQLSLDVDGVLRVSDRPVFDLDGGLDDPSISLNFTRDTGNTRFSSSVGYQEVDLKLTNPLVAGAPILDDSDLIPDNGTRRNRNVQLQFQTGVNAPLGFLFDLGYRTRSFSGTTDPDLFDTESFNYGITTFLKLSPVTTGRASYSITEYEDEEPGVRTERTTTSVSVGVTHELSPVTTIDASFGQTDVDELFRASGVTDDGKGVTGGLTVSRALVNGAISASFQRNFNTNGDRSVLRVDRSMTLPQGSLSFGVGASRGSLDETTVIGNVNFVYDLPRSQISLGASRNVSTSSRSNEVSTTSVGLNYNHDINAVSSMSVGVFHARTEDAGAGNADERQRSNISVAYNRTLTADWSMSMGYRYREFKDQNQPTARSNAIFFTLNRLFVLKP